jgi:hypothetical protein
MPVWPTFRNAPLTEENLERVKTLLDLVLENEEKLDLWKLIMVAHGSHYIHENEKGGFLNGGGKRVKYPTISLELQCWIPTLEGRKKPLYLNAWIGSYKKGSIVHLGWQYPHHLKFVKNELYSVACQIYATIAKIIYGSRQMDKDVQAHIQDSGRI